MLKRYMMIKQKDKGIYKITNILNNKYYVGSSVDILNRKCQHFRQLKLNKHHCLPLQNAWNKYGEENFKWEIIEILNDLTLLEIRKVEQRYIDADFKNQYNVSTNTMYAYSKETREKQIDSRRKTINSNNKTGYSGVVYIEKENYYQSSIRIYGINIHLGSFKRLEDAVKARKDTEEYFWQSYIKELPKHLIKEVVKQYKKTYNPIKINKDIEGIVYTKNKGYLISIYIKDFKELLLTSKLCKQETIKIKIEAETYFSSEAFLSLNINEKEKAIEEYPKFFKPLKTVILKSEHKNIKYNIKGVWELNLRINSKNVYLGCFKDINKAIKYRAKALNYFQSSEFLINSSEIKDQLIKEYKKEFYKEINSDKDRGVSYLKSQNVWRAFISIKNKTIWLGQFSTKELAIQARKDGELKYRNDV